MIKKEIFQNGDLANLIDKCDAALAEEDHEKLTVTLEYNIQRTQAQEIAYHVAQISHSLNDSIAGDENPGSSFWTHYHKLVENEVVGYIPGKEKTSEMECDVVRVWDADFSKIPQTSIDVLCGKAVLNEVLLLPDDVMAIIYEDRIWLNNNYEQFLQETGLEGEFIDFAEAKKLWVSYDDTEDAFEARQLYK